jgi:hypothetical protein
MGTTRQRRRTDWRELVSEQACSGQGVTVFCRERGIRTSSFYGWKKRLGVDDEGKAGVPTARSSSVGWKAGGPTDGSSTAGQKAAAEPPVRFLEVKLAATAEPLTPAPMIEVRLPHGRSLMVAPGFDAMHLQRLLAVLDSFVLVDKSSPAGWQVGS